MRIAEAEGAGRNETGEADSFKDTALVFGGGLAGLSAGYHLARAGTKTALFEADSVLGGLSRTIISGPFRYDIGGHRFHTRDESIETLVRDILGDELERVARSSKIFMRERFFDYPLKPANAIMGLGPWMIVRALADYGWQRVRGVAGCDERCISLEDWVVRNFGCTLYSIYFKEYSEKVWGIDCSKISQSWVSKRIEGLSLGTAIKSAFFKFSGRDIPTLTDSFWYPKPGIGRLSERLGEEIAKGNEVRTSSRLTRVAHDGSRIKAVEILNCKRSYELEGDQYISTIPMDTLVKIMDPAPPEAVMKAAGALRYRDLVIAAVKVNRPMVTDQAWIYIPERKFPFGRLHEPKNWSASMSPGDQTLVVVEFFCSAGDDIWSMGDGELSRLTLTNLEALGFLREDECIGVDVHRIHRAYPLFEVGYEGHCKTIYDYLEGFGNLHIAGRSGMFQYQNMDHAISSGREAARQAMKARSK